MHLYEWIVASILAMTWSDILGVLVQSWFIRALMPSIFQKEKPPLATSVHTSVAIAVFVVAMAIAHLWLTAILMAINGIQWAILAWQRWQVDGFKSMKWI